MIPFLIVAATNVCAGKLPGAPDRCGGQAPKSITSSSTLQDILFIAFAIIGGVALLMIIVAGLRYITSAGDPEKAARARNTIVYALIGLVLAISAEAIVAFTVGSL